MTLVCLVSLPLYQYSLDTRDTLWGHLVKGTQGHLGQSTQEHLVKGTQEHLVKGTEENLVLGTVENLMLETKGHLVMGAHWHHGENELLGHQQTPAAEAERKVAGLVERMRGQTRGLLALAGDEEGEEGEEEEEEKKLVILLRQYCKATLDNLDKLQEEWKL